MGPILPAANIKSSASERRGLDKGSDPSVISINDFGYLIKSFFMMHREH
ncbi:hypothetical protein [Aliidongia dinghuensis]|nr:hypothetical protein [Aliidongia dinghuensis]